MFIQASVFVTDNINGLAYYEICPFAINYEFVMLKSTGPRALTLTLNPHSKGPNFYSHGSVSNC